MAQTSSASACSSAHQPMLGLHQWEWRRLGRVPRWQRNSQLCSRYSNS